MGHYHAFFYETEARIRQAEKLAQADYWRMTKEARAGRSWLADKVRLLKTTLQDHPRPLLTKAMYKQIWKKSYAG